ncbi:MAG: hypothetical protein IJG50_07535 [Clostridia bacterium]|nr:hypothetical protein [Clostridia bacterium]
MSTNELTLKVRELKELKIMAEELAAEISAIEDAIKAHMGEAEEITAGEYKIRWTYVTSRRIDTTALKKAMPDVAAAFTKESKTRRFSVA